MNADVNDHGLHGLIHPTLHDLNALIFDMKTGWVGCCDVLRACGEMGEEVKGRICVVLRIDD